MTPPVCNPALGDVEVHDVEGVRHILRMDWTALCRLEQELNLESLEQLETMLARPSLALIRSLFRAGLMHHHGEIKLDEVSTRFRHTDAVPALERALRAAFPATATDDGDGGTGETTGNPT